MWVAVGETPNCPEPSGPMKAWKLAWGPQCGALRSQFHLAHRGLSFQAGVVEKVQLILTIILAKYFQVQSQPKPFAENGHFLWKGEMIK